MFLNQVNYVKSVINLIIFKKNWYFFNYLQIYRRKSYFTLTNTNKSNINIPIPSLTAVLMRGSNH